MDQAHGVLWVVSHRVWHVHDQRFPFLLPGLFGPGGLRRFWIWPHLRPDFGDSVQILYDPTTHCHRRRGCGFQRWRCGLSNHVSTTPTSNRVRVDGEVSGIHKPGICRRRLRHPWTTCRPEDTTGTFAGRHGRVPIRRLCPVDFGLVHAVPGVLCPVVLHRVVLSVRTGEWRGFCVLHVGRVERELDRRTDGTIPAGTKGQTHLHSYFLFPPRGHPALLLDRRPHETSIRGVVRAVGVRGGRPGHGTHLDGRPSSVVALVGRGRY